MSSSVIPFLGTITANLIALSPWTAVQQCIRSRSLNGTNPLPYPLIMANALAWLLYALLVHNQFIFWSNIAGWLLGLYFTTHMYSIVSQNTSPVLQRSLMLLLLGANGFVFFGAFLAFLLLADTTTSATAPTESQKNAMGYVAITVLILFYSSPLSTLMEVVRNRDASSFQWSLSLTCLVNALLWTAYGSAIQDVFVSGPNAIGVVVALIQIICKLVFPSNTAATHYDTVGETLHELHP